MCNEGPFNHDGGILKTKEHTAILELVESGEGFSRNDVTSPEASTSKIPNLCVSTKEIF